MEDGIIVGAKNLLPDSICHSDRNGGISHLASPKNSAQFIHFSTYLSYHSREKRKAARSYLYDLGD